MTVSFIRQHYLGYLIWNDQCSMISEREGGEGRGRDEGREKVHDGET